MSRRWLIFIVSASLFLLSQLYRTSNAVIAVDLLRDLSLDTDELGLLAAAFFYAFALAQVPISLLLDRVGPRRLMTVLSLVGVAGAVVFSRADALASGMAGRLLLGIGMACNLMGTLKLLTVWFEARIFATLAGIVFSIGTVGNMAATTPLVFLVEKLGWRMTFLVLAGINLLLTIVLFLVVRDQPQEGQRTPQENRRAGLVMPELKQLFARCDYWIISLGTFVRYGTFAAFQALWAGPLLLEVLGYSRLQAGNTILLTNLGLIIGGPLWGGVSDRLLVSPKRIVVGGLAALAVVMAAMAACSPHTHRSTVALLFFALGLFSGCGLLMYPHIKELVPAATAGSAMTAINFFTMLGPAVFLQGLGSLMQHLHPQASRGAEAFQTAIMVCTAALVLAGALYSFTRNPSPGNRDTDRQED
jgi:sugar phosphate permease